MFLLVDLVVPNHFIFSVLAFSCALYPFKRISKISSRCREPCIEGIKQKYVSATYVPVFLALISFTSFFTIVSLTLSCAEREVAKQKNSKIPSGTNFEYNFMTSINYNFLN